MDKVGWTLAGIAGELETRKTQEPAAGDGARADAEAEVEAEAEAGAGSGRWKLETAQ